MTKNVRIENADNSPYKVIVEIWENYEGKATLIDTKLLSNPTDLFTLAIWKNRYLVVKEAS